MSIRPWRDIHRRQSRQIMVGNVPVGGDAPVTVQTMTNTPTADANATIAQIRRCEEAGVDLIRVSCPDRESTAALGEIVRASSVPIIADIHFHYKRALEAADAGAACLRINPGNIGSADRVREVVSAAKANGCAIRIGVNAGSLERDLLEKYGEPCPEALVESALDPIAMLAAVKRIERAFGRRPGKRWSSRVLDLDLVAWSGGKHVSRGLTIPHSRLAQRDFVLGPLGVIAPHWRLMGALSARHLLARLGKRRPRS